MNTQKLEMCTACAVVITNDDWSAIEGRSERRMRTFLSRVGRIVLEPEARLHELTIDWSCDVCGTGYDELDGEFPYYVGEAHGPEDDAKMRLSVPQYALTVHTPYDHQTLLIQSDAWNLWHMAQAMQSTYKWKIADETKPGTVVLRELTLADIVATTDLGELGSAWACGTDKQHESGWTGTLTIKRSEDPE